jgi:cysteinyl-tRNA synthetase
MIRLRMHNTLGNKKEDFQPIDPQHIKIYACGPTVYHYAHIGNARMAVAVDLWVRLLRQLYPKVTYVSNITDVDDKIIQASIDRGHPIAEITEKFTKIYNADMAALGVALPDMQPRATEYIADMVAAIGKLITKGNAYEVEGHVLFHVPSFPIYGCLSRRNPEDQLAGSRIEVSSIKRDPADFVLWKPSIEGHPGWDSPWSFGRPGWHIECSVMTEKNLGLPFDIHAGGMDLTFPHHENEIAQSCAGIDVKDNPKAFAGYWIHNGFVTIDGEKMSKSLGNILLVHAWLKKYPGEVLRLTLLASHYRQPLNWTEEAVLQAKSILDRLYRTLKMLSDIHIKKEELPLPPQPLMEALADDLNTAKAITYLMTLTSNVPTKDDLQACKDLKGKLLASGRLLGILEQDPHQWLGYGETQEGGDQQYIDQKVRDREVARKNKDFAQADAIRAELTALGIEVEDSATGSVWLRKSATKE